MKTQKKTKPGRPAGRQPDVVRNALLHAAQELFAQRDFEAVSIRQISAKAGVNPAMVHYYFGDKQGLYTTLVQESLAPLLDALDAWQKERPKFSALEDFFQRYIRILAQNPWLPNLVVREVLYGRSGFREIFLRRFASRVGKALPELIRHEQHDLGQLREDLDPALASLSLLSLAIFPFVARPLAEQALGLRMDESFIGRLIEHNTRLFYEGACQDR